MPFPYTHTSRTRMRRQQYLRYICNCVHAFLVYTCAVQLHVERARRLTASAPITCCKPHRAHVHHNNKCGLSARAVNVDLGTPIFRTKNVRTAPHTCRMRTLECELPKRPRGRVWCTHTHTHRPIALHTAATTRDFSRRAETTSSIIVCA